MRLHQVAACRVAQRREWQAVQRLVRRDTEPLRGAHLSRHRSDQQIVEAARLSAQFFKRRALVQRRDIILHQPIKHLGRRRALGKLESVVRDDKDQRAAATH